MHRFVVGLSKEQEKTLVRKIRAGRQTVTLPYTHEMPENVVEIGIDLTKYDLDNPIHFRLIQNEVAYHYRKGAADVRLVYWEG